MARVLPNEVVGAAPVPVPLPATEAATEPLATPPSLWFLLAANLLPLVGVLAFGWDLFLILLLYWAESAVILLFSLLKLPFTAGLGALFLVPFFMVHAGMFMGGHLLFLVLLFGDGQPWPVARDVALVLVAFLVSHGYSFVANFQRKGESFKGHGDVMASFYKRIVVMHLTILFGGFLAMGLGSPVWAVVLLVALKTAVDAWAHLRERRRHAGKVPVPPSTS